MAKRLEWAVPALEELTDALRFIAADSFQAAIMVRERIEVAAQRAAERPELYRSGLIAGTRECVVEGTSHTLIFEVREDRVIALRCVAGIIVASIPPKEQKMTEIERDSTNVYANLGLGRDVEIVVKTKPSNTAGHVSVVFT